MQFSTIFTVLAAAMTASAFPKMVMPRGGGGSNEVNVCSSTHNTAVCCNGVLDCVVNVIASNCDQSAYCCESGDAVQGGLINLNANCLSIV
ncbi:hypothetical protein N0V88_000177 [Collariella sp. IMI 366227]|nr:hypothetical protein N0V88_000177 [Collariella sp. IMI 366227]